MDWRDLQRRHGRMVGLALGVAALAYVCMIAWRYKEQIVLAGPRTQPDLLALSVMMVVLAQIAFSLAWHALAKGAGREDSIRSNFVHWGMSLLAKYLPGKVWQGVVRSAMYGREHAAGATLTLYAREQLLSVGIAAMVVAAIPTAAVPLAMQAPMRLAFLLAGGACCACAFIQRVPDWLPRPLAQWLASGRTTTAQTLLALALNLIAYALLCGGFWLLTRSMGITTPGALQLASALCFSGLVGIAAFIVPGGLGVREAGLAWYLAPTIGMGNAALLAIASRLWIIAAEVFVSLAAWLMFRPQGDQQ